MTKEKLKKLKKLSEKVTYTEEKLKAIKEIRSEQKYKEKNNQIQSLTFRWCEKPLVLKDQYYTDKKFNVAISKSTNKYLDHIEKLLINLQNRYLEEGDV